MTHSALKLFLVSFVCLAFSSLSVFAQDALQSTQAGADELFGRAQWEQAAKAYSGIVTKEPANGLAWQNLGECNLQLKRFPEAAEAFSHSVDLKFRPLINKVNLARVFAAQGDAGAAMKALQEVAASGQAARVRTVITSAAEFDGMKTGPQFQKLLESILPCRSQEYRQFDFWIGDWEVQNPAGQAVGHNLVTLEQSGCLVVEHWTGAGGAETGTSFNYFDVRDSLWHQLYLDNSGNAGAFPAMAGKFTDGKMVLLTDASKSPVFRWTWYVLAPRKVRQMSEQSTDGQKTWQISWDSVYIDKSVSSTK